MIPLNSPPKSRDWTSESQKKTSSTDSSVFNYNTPTSAGSPPKSPTSREIESTLYPKEESTATKMKQQKGKIASSPGSPTGSPLTNNSLMLSLDVVHELLSDDNHPTLDRVHRVHRKPSPIQERKSPSPLSLLRKTGRHSVPDAERDSWNSEQTAVAEEEDEKRKSPKISPKGLRKSSDPEVIVTSPTSRRKLSEPERLMFTSPESRTFSMVDLKEETFPYQNHALTLFETNKSESHISLNNPLNLLISLNRASRLDREAYFPYPKVIIEKGLEKRVIIVKGMKNEGFLYKLLSSIYESGYVERMPTNETINRQISLLYHAALTTEPIDHLEPIINYKFLAAHIPAYLLLNEIAPIALNGATQALKKAFPTIFSSDENRARFTDQTIEDGLARFYFDLKKNVQTEPVNKDTLDKKKKKGKTNDLDENFIKINISGPGDAEVVHNCCYKIFANILTRHNYYPNRSDKDKKKKYSINNTKIPVGEITINYTLQRLPNKHPDEKHTYPLFRTEIHPSKVVRYEEDSLDAMYENYPKVTEAFYAAIKVLKASLEKQLKTKKYELDDHSILHCEEIKS